MQHTIFRVLFLSWCYHLLNVLIYPCTSITSVITFLALTFQLIKEEHGLQKRNTNQDASTQAYYFAYDEQTAEERASLTETDVSMALEENQSEVLSSPDPEPSDGVKFASVDVQTELEITCVGVQTDEPSSFERHVLVQTEAKAFKETSTQTAMEEINETKDFNLIILEENIPDLTKTSSASLDTKDSRLKYLPRKSQIDKLDAYLVMKSMKEKVARSNPSIFSDAEDSSNESNTSPSSRPLSVATLSTDVTMSSKSSTGKSSKHQTTPKTTYIDDERDETNKPLVPRSVETGPVTKKISPWSCVISKTSSETAEEFSDLQQRLSIHPFWQDSCDPRSSLIDGSEGLNSQKSASKKSSSTWLRFKNQIKKMESPFRK